MKNCDFNIYLVACAMWLLTLLHFAAIEQYRKSPFRAYLGWWYFKHVPGDASAQSARFYIDNQKNNESVYFTRATIQIPDPPTTRLPWRPFMAPGVVVAPLNATLLVFQQEPMVQFHKQSLHDTLEAVGSALLRRSQKNMTGIHRWAATALERAGFTSNVASFWLVKNCSSGVCVINGSLIGGSVVTNVTAIEYDFLDYQVRWRSLLTFCGIGVALLYYACVSDKPVWSDISAFSVLWCQMGDYGMLLVFYTRKDDFDIGDTYGFVFVGAFAFWVSFYFLGSRYENAKAAANMDIVDVPLLARWLVIAGLHNAIQFFPVGAMLLKMSYWVPQILFSALVNNRKSVTMTYACFFTVGQLLMAFGIVYFHPHFAEMFAAVMVPSTVWSALQLFVIWLQNKFGGAFFLPGKWRVSRFDYREERPPEGSECEVCLSEIQEGDAYLSTPCHHHFHEQCLLRWVQEQHNCPVCRAPLPSISIEP